jgi:hypothetical protein
LRQVLWLPSLAFFFQDATIATVFFGSDSIERSSGMTTSKKPASAAGKLLGKKKAGKQVKKVAASGLSKAKKHPKKK